MYKKILTVLLLFACYFASGQAYKGSGVGYFTGVPNTTPDSCCSSQIAMDVTTSRVYKWSLQLDAWVDISDSSSVRGIDSVRVANDTICVYSGGTGYCDAIPTSTVDLSEVDSLIATKVSGIWAGDGDGWEFVNTGDSTTADSILFLFNPFVPDSLNLNQLTDTTANLTYNDGVQNYNLGTITFGTGSGGSSTSVDTLRYVRNGSSLEIFSVPNSEYVATGTDTGAMTLYLPNVFHNLRFEIVLSAFYKESGGSQKVKNTLTFREVSDAVNEELWRLEYLDARYTAQTTYQPDEATVVQRTSSTPWQIRVWNEDKGYTTNFLGFEVEKIKVWDHNGNPIADSVVNAINSISVGLSRDVPDASLGSAVNRATELVKSSQSYLYFDNEPYSASQNLRAFGKHYYFIDNSLNSIYQFMNNGDDGWEFTYYGGNSIGVLGVGLGTAFTSGDFHIDPGVNFRVGLGNTLPATAERTYPSWFGSVSGSYKSAMFRGVGVDSVNVSLAQDSSEMIISSSGNNGHIQVDSTLEITGTMMILPRNASDPPNPEEGAIYFNTASGVLRLYNGSAWVTVDTTP